MKKTGLLSILALALIVTYSGIVHAQDIAEQPCDTKFWNQMSSRAWLEAEREIMQNQNLIFKPDSVLDYTCFNKFVDVANDPGGNIFVHTDYFQKKPIARGYDPGSMDKALTHVVSASIKAYQAGNYNHTFLGDRAKDMNISTKRHPEVPSTVGKGPYACTHMAVVWQAAKCANFVDNSKFEETDGFYPFKNMKGHNGGKNIKGYEEINDVRKYGGPNPCGGPMANNGGSPGSHAGKEQSQPSSGWGPQIIVAKNEDESKGYKFQTPLNEIFTDVGKKLKPGQCGEKGIPTGVTIYVKNEKKHEDGACTNPGCTYTSGGTCS